MPTTMFSAVVAAPGTPQTLVSSTVPALPTQSGSLSGGAGSVPLRGTSIIFQAAPTNTSAKSIFIGGKGMSIASKTGIGNVLLPGAFSPSIYIDGTTDLNDFYIDTDSVATTERVYVMVTG